MNHEDLRRRSCNLILNSQLTILLNLLDFVLSFHFPYSQLPFTSLSAIAQVPICILGLASNHAG